MTWYPAWQGSDLEKRRQLIDNVKLVVFSFYFYSVPFQPHKRYIDVFEINSPFIVTHNKYIINVTPNVMVRFKLLSRRHSEIIFFIPLMHQSMWTPAPPTPGIRRGLDFFFGFLTLLMPRHAGLVQLYQCPVMWGHSSHSKNLV